MPQAPGAPSAAPTATAAPARPVRPRPAQDTVRGNAGKDVSIISGTGDCAKGLKPMSITNRSATRTAIAKIEVLAVYNGHASKKMITIDNLAPNETRAVGCVGCTDNATGQSCTSYKLLVAVFK